MMDIALVVTWYVLGLVQSLLVLAGVALGGVLVYRTKRDAFEPLFRTDTKKDGYLTPGAAQAGGEYPEDDDLAWGRDVSKGGAGQEKPDEDPTEAVLKQTRRFLQQEGGDR